MTLSPIPLAALEGAALQTLTERWSTLSPGLQIGVGVGAALLLLGLCFAVSRRLARRARAGRQRWLVVLSSWSVVVGVGLGVWAYSLPEPERVSFVLAHQIIRVGAALFGTLAMLSVMSLSLPWALDRLERRGFVSFVAARHVRASKSGFLTVISILSIAGVAISSFALCAVVSIMGGFGADLKHKILGNNAHISIDSTAAADGEAPGLPGDKKDLGRIPWDDLLDKVRLVPGVMAATPVVT